MFLSLRNQIKKALRSKIDNNCLFSPTVGYTLVVGAIEASETPQKEGLRPPIDTDGTPTKLVNNLIIIKNVLFNLSIWYVLTFNDLKWLPVPFVDPLTVIWRFFFIFNKLLSNFFAAVAREGSGARGGADNKLGDIEPARCSQPKISSFIPNGRNLLKFKKSASQHRKAQK